MSKLYWNVLKLKTFTLFFALSSDGLHFVDFLNNPLLINNLINWMDKSSFNAVLEHNPQYVNKYLQNFQIL